MTLNISGDYTDARFMVDDDSLLEQGVIDQVRELIDHPAFTEPVVMQADTHPGAGAPVGFTMPLPDRIVPNIVGVDVGCGMAARNLGGELPLSNGERERRVRDAVPMGRSVHDYDDAPHLINSFPFDRANSVFERFNEAYRDQFGREIDPIEFDFERYDGEYFKSLCRRVLSSQRQGMGHVIKSAGTLGGGNHFVEFARARDSEAYWLVIHSGSRYLGKAVAEHWQSRATERRNAEAIRESIPETYHDYLKFDPETVDAEDLHAWVTGGMGESHLKKERIRSEFEDSDEIFEQLTGLHPDPEDRNTDLDWLEGREAHGYYVDMLFAQQYARWNRTLMCDAICSVLDVEPTERISSIHNYIDFQDMTVRKGATPARSDQRLVIPFNMADGSILARGRGNESYHQTAPHGAGRVMSRREAKETGSMDAFDEAMDGVYSESVIEAVLDEAPLAYKSADMIAEAIEPTAEIVDWLDAVHNLKAKE